MSKNALTSLLGIDTPIIQAPMAGVSTPALAAAVSNAGGLGSLGVGAMNAQGARKVIRETRELTSRPFNINVFCHAPASAEPAVEKAWTEWLAPVFAQYGATPPAKLSEIYTSFVVDDAMLEVFVDEKPAIVSFHFGLPSKEYIDALRGAGIKLIASATNVREAQQLVTDIVALLEGDFGYRRPQHKGRGAEADLAGASDWTELTVMSFGLQY